MTTDSAITNTTAVYRKSRRFALDYYLEYYFSVKENKLEQIRFGLLTLK